MKNAKIDLIASVQDGLITRRQAEHHAVGASPMAIRHALRPGGPWQKVVRGVYATFTGPLADLHRWRAAVLHGGAGSMITGATACAMVGLRYSPPPRGMVDLLVDVRCRRSTQDFVQVHRTSRLPSAGSRWRDLDLAAQGQPEWGEGEGRPSAWAEIDRITGGARPGTIPIAPLPRAVVDACRLLAKARTAENGGTDAAEDPAGDGVPGVDFADGRVDDSEGQPQGVEERLLRDTRAAMCELVQDHERQVRVDQLATEVAATPRQHSMYVRAAMDDIEAGCRSAPECELRDLVRATRGLPEPRWNQPLPGDRSITPDACWPDARLVVEVDSRAWHGFGDAPERTERRRAHYAEHGWTVIPVSPARLRTEPDAVRDQILAAYRAGLELRGAAN
jgi:very-short-patch-repair endonuclease